MPYAPQHKNIAAVKAAMPVVLHDISAVVLQIHGSMGLSDDTPLTDWVAQSFRIGLSDGPTEVHKVTVAREVLG